MKCIENKNVDTKTLYVIQDVPPEEQSSSVSTEEEKKEEVACTLSVGPFWYVSHIYKKEMERIEKENGVKITADVQITFQAEKDGSPQKALSEFTSLVQKYSSDLEASHIPLKHVDPEELKEVMKITQRIGSKLLLTLTPKEMISWGPRQSQDTFRKSTQKMLNISTSVVESGEVSHDTSLNIGMSIKDPLVNAGLTMEENYWKLMTTYYVKQVAKIKTKFGVDFKESGISQGKVEVKVCYKRSVENASMESHALRALLHLYQKIATSPLNLTHLPGATGFRGSPENLSKAGPSKGASGGSVWNGTSGNNTEAPTGGGATAGDNQEDNCSICLDTFKDKKQLKCKHEFCEACLEQSKASMGPTCPLCKDVFGMMEGDQPDGKMTTEKRTFDLNGYPGCGTIIINYNISSGNQTVNVLIYIFGDIVSMMLRLFLTWFVAFHSFCRQSIRILESTFILVKEQPTCQTTKMAKKCCACCRKLLTRSSFSQLGRPEHLGWMTW